MKKIRFFLLTAMLSIAVSSCKSSSNGTTYEVGKVKYITSFPKKIELPGTKIEMDSRSYGCESIVDIIDTTLVLVDVSGANCYFHAYSTNSNKYLSSFIKKGRGPGEYPNFPDFINTGQLNAVCLTDSYTGETVYKNIDSLVKFGYATAINKASFKVFNNGFSSLEYIDESIRIVRRVYLSPNNKAIVSYGILKDTITLREISVFDFTNSNSKNSGYDGVTIRTSYSPETKKIFCALDGFNQINVYSLSGDKEFTLCVSEEKKLYSQQDYDNTSRIMRKYFYKSTTCSDKYLFALYYNCSAVEYETDKNTFPVIQVFTFNGKPVAELVVKERLSGIKFDFEHNLLYGFTIDEELLYYNLNDIGVFECSE